MLTTGPPVKLDQIPRLGGRQIIGMALESPASNHCHRTNYWNGIVDQVLVIKLASAFDLREVIPKNTNLFWALPKKPTHPPCTQFGQLFHFVNKRRCHDSFY